MSDTTPTTARQWESLFAPADKGFFTPATDPFRDSANVVVRRMVVDLADLYRQLDESAPGWQTLTIYADVVVAPAPSADNGNFTFTFKDDNAVAAIFARVVQVAGSQAVFTSYKKDASLTIYAQSIAGRAAFYRTLMDDSTPVGVPLAIPDGAAGLCVDGTSARLTPLTNLPADELEFGRPLYWQSESSFNAAALLADKHPAIAADMLRWVQRVAAAGAETQTLAARSAALQIQLAQAQSNVVYVPLLDANLYEKLNKDYLAALQAYESAFNTFTAALSGKQDAAGSADAMLGYFQDKSGASDQLVQQTQGNLQDASDALESNTKRMNDYIFNEVGDARRAFQQGVADFKVRKEFEAGLKIAEAVITVGASLAAMAAGDGAAAGSAAGGVAEAAEAGITLAKVAEQIAKVTETLEKLMEALKTSLDAAETMIDAKDLQGSQLGAVPQLPAGGDTFDDSNWDVFAVAADHSLTPFTSGDGKIDGADDYLKTLQTLAIYGKAANAGQLAVVEYQQKLLQLRLEQATNARMRDRLTKLAASASSDADALEQAKVLYYRKLLDMKGRLILSMREQMAGLRYWTLNTDLPVDAPALVDSVGDLYAKLGAIEEARIGAIKNFRVRASGPKPMDEPIVINAQNHPDLLDQFKKEHRLVWTIGLDEPAFEHFGRVRVEDIAIYLNDEAIVDPSVTLKLVVSSSAHYYDRFADDKAVKVYEFAAAPLLDQPFQYTPNNKWHPNSPLRDAPGFAGDYFQPTPFTTWTVALAHENRAPLNLDRLTQIEFRLVGSRIYLSDVGA